MPGEGNRLVRQHIGHMVVPDVCRTGAALINHFLQPVRPSVNQLRTYKRINWRAKQAECVHEAPQLQAASWIKSLCSPPTRSFPAAMFHKDAAERQFVPVTSRNKIVRHLC
jgi:hypothetical protein